MEKEKTGILGKFLNLLRYEKEEISAVYFYAVFYGLVQLTLPLGIQSIISFVLSGAISTSIVLLIILVIGGVFVAGLLQISQMKLIEKIQQQLFVRYSFQYAHTIPNMRLREVDDYYLPELVNRFFDTMLLQKGISKLLLDVPAATIQILFGLLLLCFYHPFFIFLSFLLLASLYLIIRFTAGKGFKTSLEESDYKYRVVGYLQELARVVTTIKFSAKNALHITRTDEYVAGYLSARTSHFKILLFQYWILIGFKVFITAAMLIVGVWLLLGQQLNVGQFIAAEIVILLVINSVEKLIVNLDKVYDVMTSIEKITKVTEKPKETAGNMVLTAGLTGISVKAVNLSFGYEPGKIILDNLNFSIAEGEKICISGPYSAGKSTFLKLLSGAYSHFQGSLLLNGIPIGQYDLDSLRSRTGVMLHTFEIFEGTLQENISLGNDAVSYPEMDELAHIFGLSQFVTEHGQGYDLLLKPMGQHLPGRVIKKILLMRALIHKPQLVLLEEPWLGLEEVYAEQVRNYLLHLDATVIVVTNDKSYNEKCDKVIVLDKGAVVSVISHGYGRD
jgi:ATP-binding cassette, subfamily B, bacterial